MKDEDDPFPKLRKLGAEMGLDPERVNAAFDRACAGSNGESSQSQSGPTPLVRELPPPQPFPVAALGGVLAPAAKALMEIVQVPDALAANSVLAASALAAQAHTNVQTLGGPKPLSLYVLTVAASGDRKSACDDLALVPVREFARQRLVTYKADLTEWERAQAGVKLDRTRKREQAKDGDEYAAALGELKDEPQPRKPWFICSEPTAEGLVLSLAEGQYAQGIFTDEGGQFIGSHAFSDESELRTIALMSRLWQGSPIDRVRAKDREHVILHGRRLSVHPLCQPDVAAQMLGKSLYRSQGFLARWLIAAPESLAGSRLHNPQAPEAVADNRLRRYWLAVRQLLERSPVEDHDVGGLDPPCLGLSPEAQQLLAQAYNDLERAQARGGKFEAVREWAGKAAEHACRIAGVLTAIGEPAAINVSVETMRGALELTRYYLAEYERLIGIAGISEEMRSADLLLKWITRRKLGTLTSREVMRLGPNSIRGADKAKAAIRALVEYEWLSTEDGKTYLVHPAAFKTQDES